MVGISVSELIARLEEAKELKNRGKAYSRVCQISGRPDITVVSWKFNEWDYGKFNIKLPCNARGLFLLQDSDNPRVMARGYDKFFNVGEIAATRWEELEKNTIGPYEVTLKANGCIVFVVGLQDDTLVVCSKHSTGPRNDIERNHSLAAEQFLKKMLSDQRIDSKQLARELYRQNVTIVAEYCDDSFEEHILEYDTNKAGLYIHGVNYNTPEFRTWSMDKVHALGQRYGFKQVTYVIKEDIAALREFLEGCSSEGGFSGEEVEGFVIRTHLKFQPHTPYFFKYKLEEPYLMYRQWREVTKDYIVTKSRKFNFKKHKFITNQYLDYATPILDGDEQLRNQYLRGYGIIKLRKGFLEAYGMNGMEILNHEKIMELQQQNTLNYDVVDEKTKFLIVPIAVIGCGKTTISLTLTNLFPQTWAHVQNDDITGKDRSMLVKNALQKLAEEEIRCVIIDRNNHQYRERQEIFDWIAKFKEEYLPYDTNIKIIGVSFLDRDSIDGIRDITIKRVFLRGDNHQSIKASKYGEKKVLGIMSGFINRFQPVNDETTPDSTFDHIIHLKVLDDNSSLQNTRIILNELLETYPVLVPKIPSDESIREAFIKSLSYKPTITKIVRSGNDGSKPSKKRRSPYYFAADVRDYENLKSFILNAVNSANISDTQLTSVRRLYGESLFQHGFHVTLSHKTQGSHGNKFEKQLWKTYLDYYHDRLPVADQIPYGTRPAKITTGDFLRFQPKLLCWDDKIVTLIIEINEGCVFNSESQPVKKLGCSNATPHITLGRLSSDIKAVYSNTLCERIQSGENLDESTNVLMFSNQISFVADISLNF